MVRIAFIGDTLLGGDAQPTLDRHGLDYALAGIMPVLAGSDLVVANHEGPLTAAERRADKAEMGRKRYWYRGHPDAASALARAGVRVASLGNNHVLDYGAEGLSDTITALEAAGIATCGAGPDEAIARRPAIVELGGYRIGFISCMQRYQIYVRERGYATRHRSGPYRLRLDRLRDDLAALRGTADFRVVMVHWGRNYRPVTSLQERLAVAIREAGADLVIGHHPHIAQRVDTTGGRPVLFSLGNGPLGTPGRFHSGRPPYGLIATVDLDTANGRLGVELRLVGVDNSVVGFRPVPVDDPEARRFLRSLVSPAEPWLEVGPALRVELTRVGRVA